jgi:hypothetical protein
MSTLVVYYSKMGNTKRKKSLTGCEKCASIGSCAKRHHGIPNQRSSLAI